MKIDDVLLHLQRQSKKGGVCHLTSAYFGCVGGGVIALTSDFKR